MIVPLNKTAESAIQLTRVQSPAIIMDVENIKPLPSGILMKTGIPT
jgi:hypothetical protein